MQRYNHRYIQCHNNDICDKICNSYAILNAMIYAMLQATLYSMIQNIGGGCEYFFNHSHVGSLSGGQNDHLKSFVAFSCKKGPCKKLNKNKDVYHQNWGIPCKWHFVLKMLLLGRKVDYFSLKTQKKHFKTGF